jgi:Cu/Ag efflux protein CusF
MTKWTRILMLGLLLGCLGGVATAAEEQAAGVDIQETVTATAKVKAVDKETRKVTLAGEEGGDMVVTAGPEVKNFDQIKVGDEVVAVYTKSLVLSLADADEPPAAGGAAAVGTAPMGAKPAVAGAAKVSLTAEVVKIDKAKRLVTLKGPKGNEVTVEVDPSVKKFDELKVGDDINATYTEAMAIEVRKP